MSTEYDSYHHHHFVRYGSINPHGYKQIEHLEDVIEAYKRPSVNVEPGGTLNQNFDSNVLLGGANNCEFNAGKEAVG